MNSITLSKSGGRSTMKHFSSLNGFTIYELDVVKLVNVYITELIFCLGICGKHQKRSQCSLHHL